MYNKYETVRSRNIKTVPEHVFNHKTSNIYSNLVWTIPSTIYLERPIKNPHGIKKNWNEDSSSEWFEVETVWSLLILDARTVSFSDVYQLRALE